MVLPHSAVSVRLHPPLMLEQGRNSGTRDRERTGSHRHEPHTPERPTEAHACPPTLGKRGFCRGQGQKGLTPKSLYSDAH